MALQGAARAQDAGVLGGVRRGELRWEQLLDRAPHDLVDRAPEPLREAGVGPSVPAIGALHAAQHLRHAVDEFGEDPGGRGERGRRHRRFLY